MHGQHMYTKGTPGSCVSSAVLLGTSLTPSVSGAMEAKVH